MAKAYSTINTTLFFGVEVTNLAKLTKIKSYPDLGGSPDLIETTDLEDTQQAFVPGVISLDSMEFTANFTPDAYDAVYTQANTEGTYELRFGNVSDADYAAFTWEGQHVVYVNGGDVNGVREMTIVVTPSTAITKKQ